MNREGIPFTVAWGLSYGIACGFFT